MNSRVRHYMQWNSNNPHYLTLNEVHTLFIDYFLQLSAKFVKKEEGFDFGDPFNDVVDNAPAAAKTSVSIDEWVEVWGELVFSAANRLIGEVVQSRRRPLLGPSPG